MTRKGIAFRLALIQTASRYAPGWLTFIEGKVEQGEDISYTHPGHHQYRNQMGTEQPVRTTGGNLTEGGKGEEK